MVDLRSDTVTRPTKGMLEAMVHATVGDDVFGDDPTVIQLQEKVADILGKEDALFVPSGTMANQIAIKILTNPGDEVYCDAGCHLMNYESGAPSFLSGVQLRAISTERGIFNPSQLDELIRPNNIHFPPSKLVTIENTHNRAGGTVWSVKEVEDISNFCKNFNLLLHLDGARIWNAAVAANVKVKEWTQYADTVTVCFSKGLGAPIGSAIVSTKEKIQDARRIRKRLGGGMRQVGYLAACAIYALDHHRERLIEDHIRAKRLAEALETLGYTIRSKDVQTNIVIFEVPEKKNNNELVEFGKKEGVLFTAFGKNKIRLVTHLDVNDDGIEKAIHMFKKYLVH
ncbi:MAG: aminotransferase class I/II-fold pyridoxal phosphate-dependent enzyme [bacterium]|nr:aminotransferase class I/II-fold pyridoxal phosphate-dependent enzyme [bacterium]